MKKATKGALAAGAAGSLLLGGAGSLAYWTTSQTITGGDITSGHLKLNGTGCDGWMLDDGGTPVAFTGQHLVPGDSVTNHCAYTVAMDGTHLTAKLNVSAFSMSGALASTLTPTATYTLDGNPLAANTDTVISDGQAVVADITVAYAAGSTDLSKMDLTATLNNVTVTATQQAHP